MPRVQTCPDLSQASLAASPLLPTPKTCPAAVAPMVDSPGFPPAAQPTCRARRRRRRAGRRNRRSTRQARLRRIVFLAIGIRVILPFTDGEKRSKKRKQKKQKAGPASPPRSVDDGDEQPPGPHAGCGGAPPGRGAGRQGPGFGWPYAAGDCAAGAGRFEEADGGEKPPAKKEEQQKAEPASPPRSVDDGDEQPPGPHAGCGGAPPGRGAGRQGPGFGWPYAAGDCAAGAGRFEKPPAKKKEQQKAEPASPPRSVDDGDEQPPGPQKPPAKKKEKQKARPASPPRSVDGDRDGDDDGEDDDCCADDEGPTA
eukprot:TRINITY_DN687_c0_g1_i2.p2 TRINITY_DN687_c0_g1~~TRINITY_DN687_c0_g1_i2.p2  ORF type:complete len:351 (+),score=32.15 TRINITY_DN687_c0_g1_i2:121-1053(+)